jgi:hypothetical protein
MKKNDMGNVGLHMVLLNVSIGKAAVSALKCGFSMQKFINRCFHAWDELQHLGADKFDVHLNKMIDDIIAEKEGPDGKPNED